MSMTVLTYFSYLLVAVPLTVWVATTLSRNGRVFLADVFDGNDDLADAVNRLLVVGFYLLNLGFVTLYLRVGTEVRDAARPGRDAEREDRHRDARARGRALLQRLRLQQHPPAQPHGGPAHRTGAARRATPTPRSPGPPAPSRTPRPRSPASPSCTTRTARCAPASGTGSPRSRPWSGSTWCRPAPRRPAGASRASTTPRTLEEITVVADDGRVFDRGARLGRVPVGDRRAPRARGAAGHAAGLPRGPGGRDLCGAGPARPSTRSRGGR